VITVKYNTEVEGSWVYLHADMQLLSEPNADLEMTSLLMWRANDFGRALYSKSFGIFAFTTS